MTGKFKKSSMLCFLFTIKIIFNCNDRTFLLPSWRWGYSLRPQLMWLANTRLTARQRVYGCSLPPKSLNKTWIVRNSMNDRQEAWRTLISNKMVCRDHLLWGQSWCSRQNNDYSIYNICTHILWNKCNIKSLCSLQFGLTWPQEMPKACFYESFSPNGYM